jgi:membrane associated rhomboid family serine protease
VPAVFFLGIWILQQSLSGFLSLAAPTEGGGVAWWAHIGGFAVGAAVAAVLRNWLRPAPTTIVLTRRRHSWSPRRH